MKFTEALEKILKENNKFTRTENNGKQFSTTNSALLDLFATIGAMRNKSDEEVATAFINAYAENPLLATRMAFYARDIRHGGLGERKVFRTIINLMGQFNPDTIKINIDLIPFFGRFDDLFALIDTQAEKEMWDYIYITLAEDMANVAQGESISQLAKWMPSINTSSKETCKLAKLCAKHLFLSERAYRKILSRLRKHIDIVERKMSNNRWDEINYPAVPSNAMKLYRNAFGRHSPEKFAEYMTKVAGGTEKINATTLYPYDILRDYGFKFITDARYQYHTGTNDFDAVLEAQWKALPNYVSGDNNVLVMADTSGSMSGLPLQIAMGLAVYFAERNTGAYQNLFLTFSNQPEYVKLSGKTLKEKLSGIKSIVANTDIEKAFDLILQTAIDNDVPQLEMPSALIVISDMEFDESTDDNRSYKTAKKKFQSAGYELPSVIFWNVAQRTTGFQVRADTDNVLLVSGSSAGTFKEVLNNIGSTPYDFMTKVLNGEPYNQINLG